MKRSERKKFKDPLLQMDDAETFSISSSSESENSEIEARKRIKIAKKFIQNIETEGTEIKDAHKEFYDEEIKRKLEEEHFKNKGYIQKTLADTFKNPSEAKKLTKHTSSPTSLAVTTCGTFLFSGDKGGGISKWDLISHERVSHRSRKKKKDFTQGHSKSVLALVLCSEDKILASGGKGKFIYIWKTEDLSLLQILKGHKNSITSLTFCNHSSKLYSASFDHTIRSWNLETFSFVETLFGHETEVNCIDAGPKERILSCSSDRTARAFKIATGTQLIFKTKNAHQSSIDCCAYMSPSEFILGSQDGTVSFWNLNKKDPIGILPNAHSGSWITSLATIFGSDCVASGSSDGFLRIWKWKRQINKKSNSGNNKRNDDSKEENTKKNKSIKDKTSKTILEEVAKIKIPGFINSIQFFAVNSKNSKKLNYKLFIAAGKEHRLGRWDVLKDVENRVYEVDLVEKANK